MAMEYEDSRMSIGSNLSNLSPGKLTQSETTTNQNTNTFSSLLPLKERRISVEEAPVSESTDLEFITEHASEDSPQHCTSTSWFDIVEQEKAAELNQSAKVSHSVERKRGSPSTESERRGSMDENSNSNVSLRSSNSGREIEIDILDSANVEKYEKLIRDEKIKSPFKRRLSGGGEEGEIFDGHADFEESGGNGTPQHKKTKTGESDHGRERFRRDSSSSSGDGSSQSSRKSVEYEKDLAILERRQKQIDYGKNTLCYENYLKQVPKDKRTKDHPRTPPKHIKYSRRAWDGVVKVWRKQLHCFDPDGKVDTDD